MAGSKKALKDARVKSWCDRILAEFNRGAYLSTDPISFVYRYKNPQDQEVVALISALFAFGNVKAILNTLEGIFRPLGDSPAKRLSELSPREFQKIYRNSYYRFFESKDISFFLERVGEIVREYKTLGNFFQNHWDSELLDSLARIRKIFMQGSHSSYGARFMFPDPKAGVAKRWHMLLRWMVRKDEIDLGLWTFIAKSSLIQPLDTHLFEISRALGLTRRKTPSLAAALEITDHFRGWDAEDPMKYDFALCRIGVLGLKKNLPSF